jgi:hypothetical protein
MPALTTVAHYYDNSSAEVACSVLNDIGIPVFLFDRHLAHQNVSLLVAMGGLRLMAPAEHAAEARNLLETPDDLTPNDDSEDCPACGASCSFRPALLIFGLLGFLLSGALFLFRRNRRICRNCAHTWHQKP